MRCPYCGHNNPRNARKCAVCGRRLDKVRERRKEKRILLTGIVLIAVILSAGIGAMFGISHILDSTRTADEQPKKVTILATPTPVPETEDSSEAVDSTSTGAETVSASSEEVTPTPEPAEAAVTASLVGDDRKAQLSAMGYAQVGVSSATASSVIQQDGIDNTPHVLYDGQLWSSWQDGVDGDGIGENITFNFDRAYNVRYLILRLGNWYDTDDYYYRNNRPSKMTFILGDDKFDVDFPDQKTEFTLELSEDVEASGLQMIIDGVYPGTMYQDTCINEVDVYGKPADGSTEAVTASSGQ